MGLLLFVVWVRFGSHFDCLLRRKMQLCKRGSGLLRARRMCWPFAGRRRELKVKRQSRWRWGCVEEIKDAELVDLGG